MESCGKTPPRASDRPETRAPHHLSARRRFTSQRRSNEVNYVAPSQAGPAPCLDCPCCGTSPGPPSPRTTRKWSSLHAASNVSQLFRSIKSTRPPVAGPQLTGANSTEIDKMAFSAYSPPPGGYLISPPPLPPIPHSIRELMNSYTNACKVCRDISVYIYNYGNSPPSMGS